MEDKTKVRINWLLAVAVLLFGILYHLEVHSNRTIVKPIVLYNTDSAKKIESYFNYKLQKTVDSFNAVELRRRDSIVLLRDLFKSYRERSDKLEELLLNSPDTVLVQDYIAITKAKDSTCIALDFMYNRSISNKDSIILVQGKELLRKDSSIASILMSVDTLNKVIDSLNTSLNKAEAKGNRGFKTGLGIGAAGGFLIGISIKQ